MRFYTLLYVLLTFMTSSFMNAQDLEAYQWENRILVLFDKSIDTEPLQSQLQAFTANNEALVDRNLIIFLVAENSVYDGTKKPVEMNAECLRENLGIEHSFNGTVLIGKDGGIKMKKEFQVDPETVFTLIDGMPMRRAEMRKSRKS